MIPSISTASRISLPLPYQQPTGIATGSQHPFLSILALNVRTEIAYGLFTDGCTAISHRTHTTTHLAQNWDWQTPQKANLIHLLISQPSRPSIDIITEAGIIGKIGLNSSGVGVCLNAIRALGVDWGRVPVHLALRVCLDSRSREEAVGRAKEMGVASACNIFVADASGAVGLECSHRDVVELAVAEDGVLCHTNHFVVQHPGVDDHLQWADSKPRLARVEELVREMGEDHGKVGGEEIEKILEDEQGWPASICREEINGSMAETLFSVVMDLEKKKGRVRIGRPAKVQEVVELKPL